MPTGVACVALAFALLGRGSIPPGSLAAASEEHPAEPTPNGATDPTPTAEPPQIPTLTVVPTEPPAATATETAPFEPAATVAPIAPVAGATDEPTPTPEPSAPPAGETPVSPTAPPTEPAPIASETPTSAPPVATATPADSTASPPVASPESEASPTAPTDPTPSPTAETATPAAEDAGVTVTALSAHGSGIPGQTLALRYRVTNTTEATATVRLVAADRGLGWPIELYAADGFTAIAGPVSIPAGAGVEVVVQVTIPPEAYRAETNAIALDALPTGEAGAG